VPRPPSPLRPFFFFNQCSKMTFPPPPRSFPAVRRSEVSPLEVPFFLDYQEKTFFPFPSRRSGPANRPRSPTCPTGLLQSLRCSCLHLPSPCGASCFPHRMSTSSLSSWIVYWWTSRAALFFSMVHINILSHYISAHLLRAVALYPSPQRITFMACRYESPSFAASPFRQSIKGSFVFPPFPCPGFFFPESE